MFLNHLFALSVFLFLFLSYSSADFLQKLVKWNILTSRGPTNSHDDPSNLATVRGTVKEKSSFDVQSFLT